jgi:hypothetical protein
MIGMSLQLKKERGEIEMKCLGCLKPLPRFSFMHISYYIIQCVPCVVCCLLGSRNVATRSYRVVVECDVMHNDACVLYFRHFVSVIIHDWLHGCKLS